MCIKKGTSQTMPLISRSHGIAKKPKNKSNNGKIILHKKKILIDSKKQLTVNDLVNNFVAAKVEPEEIIDNKIQVEKESQVRDGTRAFIAVMLHTLNCSSCENAKCKKMKMVMSHYIKCLKLKNGENCTLCRQLLRVVAEHALYLCPNLQEGSKLPCPVPMCDVMRHTVSLQKN